MVIIYLMISKSYASILFPLKNPICVVIIYQLKNNTVKTKNETTTSIKLMKEEEYIDLVK